MTTVYLWRHAEKNPSTAAIDPNQLTEQGRRDALASGANLHSTGGYSDIGVYCSVDDKGNAVDRSFDTGWYIRAGFAGLVYDGANELFRSDSSERAHFAPMLEALLKQEVPERIVSEYKAKKISRAQAMEQCYRMLSHDSDAAPAERQQVLRGALHYLAAVFSYLESEQNEQYRDADDLGHGIVLVGHDPNIGCLGQLLESDHTLSELLPLTGINFERNRAGAIEYSFFVRNGTVREGVVVPSLEVIASVLAGKS